MSDLPDDMIPDSGPEDEYSLVLTDEDAPACPDCGSEMAAKAVRRGGYESDSDTESYRCPECHVVDETEYCGICGRHGALGVTVTDDDGGVFAEVCGRCVGRFRMGDECAICDADTSGEYHVILPPVEWGDPDYTVCSECRRRWVFDNTQSLMKRLWGEGVERFGGVSE